MRKAALILSIVNLVVMIAAIALCLPDTVAIHYGLNGEADGWGSRWTYAIFSILPLALILFYEWYHRSGRSKNVRVEEKLIPLMVIFFIAVCWILFPFGPQATSISTVRLCSIVALLGLLMVVISNYMGKLRQNPHMGLKTPWTLKNETVWKKAHRLGGFTGTLGGVVIILGSLIGMTQPETAFLWCMGGLIAGILLTVVIPTVYSAWLYHKLKK